MLSTEEFADWSKGLVLFLHLTTRVKSDPDQSLLRDKGFSGFPSLAILDASGELLSKHPLGKRDLGSVVAMAEQAEAFAKLRAKAEAGDTKAKARVLVSKLEMNLLTHADGCALFETLSASMTGEQREQAELFLITREFTEAEQALRGDGPASSDYFEARKQLILRFFADGKIPTGIKAPSFLSTVMRHAETQGDVKMYERALEALIDRVGDRETYYTSMIKRARERLEKMR